MEGEAGNGWAILVEVVKVLDGREVGKLGAPTVTVDVEVEGITTVSSATDVTTAGVETVGTGTGTAGDGGAGGATKAAGAGTIAGLTTSSATRVFVKGCWRQLGD